MCIITKYNKPSEHGNMRHAFDGAKLFISNTRCRLRPDARTSHAHSQTATSVRNYTILPRQKHGAYYREQFFFFKFGN